MKRVSTRIREFSKRFALIEIAVIGLLSGLKALLPGAEWHFWLIIFGLISAVSTVWVWKTTRPVHLPEVVLDTEEKEGEAVLKVPMPHNMLAVANKHARSLYGRSAPSLADIEKWWNRNPFVEAALCSEYGDYLGYFDILPLNEEGRSLLECGKIRECEIPTECILSPTKMKNAVTLYLAGVAIKGVGTEIGKDRAAKLFYGLASYIEKYYGKTARRVLTLAATSDGERLLKGIQAKIICPGDARKDKQDLYEILVSPALLQKTKSRASARAKPPQLVFESVKKY